MNSLIKKLQEVQRVEIKTLVSLHLYIFFVLHGLCLTSSTLWLLRVTKIISPHNINTIWSRQVLRIQENITFRGLFIDPIPNSPNSHNKNCMAEIKGNYQSDLDSEGVSLEISWLKLFSLDYPLRTLNNYWINILLIFSEFSTIPLRS